MRPAVIIQNDLLNKSKIQTTVVALLTSNIKLARVPGNIRLKKGFVFFRGFSCYSHFSSDLRLAAAQAAAETRAESQAF